VNDQGRDHLAHLAIRQLVGTMCEDNVWANERVLDVRAAGS
jgi:hypothetical protein